MGGLSMKWLHISDIHFNFKGFDTSNVRNKLIEKLEEIGLKIDFILITGDCLYKYGKENFNVDEIASYIKKIAKSCNCNKKNIYICQGNHDLNRDELDRNSLIVSILNGENDFDKSYKKLSKNGSDRFQLLTSKVNNITYESYKVHDPKGQKFRIISLNSCLLSKDKNDYGKLRVCNSYLNKLESAIQNDDKINILIMHHGIDFLEVNDAIKFEHWAEDHYIDMVFTGHTHRSAVQTFDNVYRNIGQFTAGAIVVDDYAVPSFFLCEYEEGYDVSIKLFTYSKDTETWTLDNRSLRKFKTGALTYRLTRVWEKMYNLSANVEDQLMQCKHFINKLNQMYESRYGDTKIYSSNEGGSDNFDVNKIIRSLGAIGVPFEKSLDIASQVVLLITHEDFKTDNDYLSCKELRDVIYDQIISQKADTSNSELMLGCWASRYARKYKRGSEIIITSNNSSTKMNYNYIQQILLKRIFDKITENEAYYLKIYKSELQRMSERILDFFKNMGVFEIREEILESLIIEYITQKPHPWVVNNNKEQLISYHLSQAEEHIERLKNNTSLILAQTEASYHICAAFLIHYNRVIGCTETYPLTVLNNTLNGMNNENNMYNKLPIPKYQIIQLKKDLEKSSLDFTNFTKNINKVYDNIVTRQDVTNDNTVNSLITLWNMLLKMHEYKSLYKIQFGKNSFERIRNIFESGTGFVVKSPLRALPSCFWLEANWVDYEIKQQHLGKQILVCIIDSMSDVDNICKHLFEKNTKGAVDLTELIFAYSTYQHFTKEERNQIRVKFCNKQIKCVFIQEENYSKISDVYNWREILFEVIRISRFS